MKIHWIKLIWWIVVLAIVALSVKAYDSRTDPLDTWHKLGETPYVAPVPNVTLPPPVVFVPVVTPVPVIIHPKPKPASKSKVKRLSCSQIPSVAFSFPLDQVLAVAKGRGLTPVQLADLTTCWQARQSNG